jgi:hypothetical protein
VSYRRIGPPSLLTSTERYLSFPGSRTQRRMETRLPATRYRRPISPRGDVLASTFLIVVSDMVVCPLAIQRTNFAA